MEEQVVILEVDDWTALYVNGESIWQGHSLQFWMLKSFLSGETPLRNINESPHSHSDAIDNYAHQSGQLPDTYEEVERVMNAPRD